MDQVTVPETALGTYAVLPSGVTAMAMVISPTLIGSPAALLVVRIGVTILPSPAPT